MGVRIYPRSPTLQRVKGPLTDWQWLEVETTWLPGGSWSVSVPAASPKTAALLEDRAGVLIRLDGDYLISGPVEDVAGDDRDGIERLTISGPSDSVAIHRRRAEPCHPAIGDDVIAYLSDLYDQRGLALTAEIAGFNSEIAAVASSESVVSGLTAHRAEAQAKVDALTGSDPDFDYYNTEIASLDAQIDQADAALSGYEQLVSQHADQLVADVAELAGIPALKTAMISRINSENESARERYYLDAAYDTFSGRGEQAIKHYVGANLGSEAFSPRQLDRFTIADDNGFGSHVSVQARFDMLGELLPAIAVTSGDLGYGITQQGTQLVFDVYQPTDATKSMRFSKPWKTLASFKWSKGAPDLNETLVAGQGEGTARQFVHGQVDDLITRYGLIENGLHDRRDTDDVSTLASAVADDMAKATENLAVSFTASESEARGYRRGWDNGYYCTLQVGTLEFVEMVRSTKLTWDNEHSLPKVEPLLASPSAIDPNVLPIFRDQKRLASRTLRLERV